MTSHYLKMKDKTIWQAWATIKS